jgi:hypothetical protein
MRFWRRPNYVEHKSLFQVNDDSLSDDHADSLTNGNHVPSGSLSPCSSSSSYTCLASDPMHEGNDKASTGTVYGHNVCKIAVDGLCIGDVLSDEEGMDWVVRQCFCQVSQCSGKTFKQLEGKEEMDAWDRGRHQLEENLDCSLYECDEFYANNFLASGRMSFITWGI